MLIDLSEKTLYNCLIRYKNRKEVKVIRASKAIQLLKEIPLFSVLDEKQCTELCQSSRLCDYSPGQTLESNGCLTVVLKGRIAVIKQSGEKKLLMKVLTQGAVTGVASLYSDGLESVSSLTAEKPSSVLHVPEREITSLIKSCGAFAESYVQFLTSRIRFLNRRIKSYTSGSAEAKLALHILMCDEAQRGEVDPGVSYTALAEMLDVGRASLYRALDDLTAKGIISRNGRKIIIIDRLALSDASNGIKD